MGDANAKIGRQTIHHPTIGKYSFHETTNENVLRLIEFAAGRQMAIRSTYFMHNPGILKIDALSTKSIMIDGRHFSDIIDVKAQRGANIDSDHILDVLT
jgi:hypothetical protein